MNFNPPIESRSDKELFEITSNSENWDSEAVLIAKKELIILIVCAPYIFISMFSTFLPRIGKTVMELENEGFHKLKWQRLTVLTLANMLWFFVLSVWLNLF